MAACSKHPPLCGGGNNIKRPPFDRRMPTQVESSSHARKRQYLTDDGRQLPLMGSRFTPRLSRVVIDRMLYGSTSLIFPTLERHRYPCLVEYQFVREIGKWLIMMTVSEAETIPVEFPREIRWSMCMRGECYNLKLRSDQRYPAMTKLAAQAEGQPIHWRQKAPIGQRTIGDDDVNKARSDAKVRSPLAKRHIPHGKEE